MPFLPTSSSSSIARHSLPAALPTVQKLLPLLHKDLQKGELGRIGVVGGSPVYTGAPYFSAITALKVGCDMVHVFCPPDAANVIKSYSPELMVHPSYDNDSVSTSLHRIDAFILGPGLGREDKTISTVEFVIECAKRKDLPIVIDADGLFLLTKKSNLMTINHSKAVLTPNHYEFGRLYQSCFDVDSVADEQVESGEAARELAKRLGCTIFQKGPVDVITNGFDLHREFNHGSFRRCGGQGDLLNGAIAVFAFWALRQNVHKPMISAGIAASQLIRQAAHLSFLNHGRSSTASDMIAQIPELIKLCEPQ